MACWAMRDRALCRVMGGSTFIDILRTPLLLSVAVVVANRSKCQMIWIHTGGVVALVHNDDTVIATIVRNRATMKNP